MSASSPGEPESMLMPQWHIDRDGRDGHALPGRAARADHAGLDGHAGRSGHGGHDEHDHAAMFRRRFWFSLALSIPVFAFSEPLRDWLGLPEIGRAHV